MECGEGGSQTWHVKSRPLKCMRVEMWQVSKKGLQILTASTYDGSVFAVELDHVIALVFIKRSQRQGSSDPSQTFQQSLHSKVRESGAILQTLCTPIPRLIFLRETTSPTIRRQQGHVTTRRIPSHFQLQKTNISLMEADTARQCVCVFLIQF